MIEDKRRMTRIYLTGILILAVFLLTYRLHELMMFIGDFAWFYLSARDMLITGEIPLIGIPSSRPWLHQGPLWTYLLAPGMFLSQFHPLSGAYTAVLFGLGSVFLAYVVGKTFFSERVGLITALLFATSPLIIIHARMPYHTAPIPFFTFLLLYSLYRWVQGNPYYFPLTLLSLCLLYHLELATVLYWFLFFGILGWGLYSKKTWMAQLKNRRVLPVSFFAIVLPMLPIFIYDFRNGFPQTVKFMMWMGYKVLTIFGYPVLHPEIPSASFSEVVVFFADHLRKLLFLPNTWIALAIFLFSIVLFTSGIFKPAQIRGKKKQSKKRWQHVSTAEFLLGIFSFVGIGGFFVTKTASEAYLPMLFPSIMLVTALFFERIIRSQKFTYIGYVMLLFLCVTNILSLQRQNYLMAVPLGGYGPTFEKRLQVAQAIVNGAAEKRYTVNGAGEGSEFESYTMSYEYLTWWMGHGPSKDGGNLQYIVDETPDDIHVTALSIEE